MNTNMCDIFIHLVASNGAMNVKPSMDMFDSIGSKRKATVALPTPAATAVAQ